MTEAGRPPLTIFAHAFYVDVWREMSARLDALALSYQMVVTSPHPRADLDFPGNARAIEFHRVENRGRDIRPFLLALGDTAFETDICLKLHTKKSPHRSDGERWRQTLLHDLLGTPAETACIFDLIAANPAVGIVAPDGHLVSVSQFPGANARTISRLLGAYGFDETVPQTAPRLFVAGSMFWFRSAALRQLHGKADIVAFETEHGQTDGTTAHAYERVFVLLAGLAGYISLTRGELESGEPASLAPHRFADPHGGNRVVPSGGPVEVSPFVAGTAEESETAWIAGLLRIRLARRIYTDARVRRLYRKLPRRLRLAVRRALGLPH